MRNSKFSFVFALFFVLMSVSAFAVSVTPSNAASNLDLTCNAGNPASAYIYEWYLNGNRYLVGGNAWVVSNGLTSVGQTWRCDVYYNVAGKRIFYGSGSTTIINTPPVTTITSFRNGTEGQTQINFTGTAVDNVDFDSISSWNWNFGDGNTANSANSASHIYLKNGTYTLRLTATDSNGGSSSATKQIVIADRAPVVNFSSTTPSPEGKQVNFTDLSVSYDPIVSRLWSFGDGATSNIANASHTYGNNGTYLVTLNVTDNDGSLTSFSRNVAITDLGPFANFSQNATIIKEGQYVSYNDLSTTPLDFIVGWQWEIQDGFGGSGSNNQNISFRYLRNGTYSINLTVTDSDGSTSFATRNITVNEVNPVANFTVSSTNVTVGQIVTLTDTSYSFPDTTIAWFWAYPGPWTPGTAIQNITFSTPGTYGVYHYVTDSDGSSSFQSGPINITVNPAPYVNDTTPPASVIMFSINRTNSTMRWTWLNPSDLDFNQTKITISGPLLSIVNMTLVGTPGSFGVYQNYTQSGLQPNQTYKIIILTADNKSNVNQTPVSFSATTLSNPAISAVHDVLVSRTYVDNVNGVRLSNSTGGNQTGNLVQGQLYTIGYRTDNVGTASETIYSEIVVINSTGNVFFINSHSNGVAAGNNFAHNTDVWNTAGFAPGIYTIQANASVPLDVNASNDLGSRSVTLVLPFVPDTTPPTVTIQSPINNSNYTISSIPLQFTRSDASGVSSCRYKINAGVLINLPSCSNSTITGLGNATYTLTLLVNDTLQNQKVSTRLFHVNTSVPDITPPVISLISVVNRTNSTARINWTTNEISNTSIRFWRTLPGTISGINDAVLTHSRSLSGLRNGTIYNYNVTSCDISGNCKVNGTLTFTTLQNPGIIVILPHKIFNSVIDGKPYPANTSSQVTVAAIDTLSNVTSSTMSGVTTVINSTILRSTTTGVASFTNCVIIDTNPYTGANCLNEYWDPSIRINSTTTGSRVINSTVINSVATYSNITKSNLTSVTMTKTVITNSVASNSNIQNSNIVNSNIISSTVNNSTLNNVFVSANSVLINIVATNSNITNTSLSGFTLNGVVIVNSNIVSGSITLPNGVIVTGPAQVPRAPTLSSINPLSGLVGNGISFTSNAADANNNIVSYNWSFGDGNTANTANPQNTYGANGNYLVSLIVKDSTNLSASYSNMVSITTPSSGSSGSGSSGSGSGRILVDPLNIDKTLLVISGRYNWDLAKDGLTFTKTMRPIDSIIFNYQGTSYSLVVDEFKPDGLVAFKIIPTDEIRSGYKGDNFEFAIKDKKLIVSLLELDYNKKIDSESTMKLQLKLVDGNYVPKVTPKASSNGVIKIMGEIVPRDTSVPVGVGISLATVVIGLLLFLGLRVLIV